MTSGAAGVVVLAHHPVVEALPAVVPMVLLVGTFVGIVVADRRRSRREETEAGQRPDPPGAQERRDQAR